MTSGSSATIDVLTPIWQRVLRRSRISPDASFFSLGGDPKSARLLFFEIARSTARVLPPEIIYQAPTISALARILADPRQPQLPPITLLTDSGEAEGPPIFLAHGLGGSVFEFFALVKSLQVPQPIYGMEAKGNDGVDAPFDRVEDLAQYYLEAITHLQAEGPYFLVGYSLGGLIMLEVARRLTAANGKIALLAMIDSYPHPTHLSVGQRLRLTSRRVRRFSLLANHRYPRLRDKRNARHGSADILSFPLQRAHDCAYLAWMQYEPRSYSGAVNFLRAEIPTIYPKDPNAVWGKLIKKLETETVPGDHHGMLETNSKQLGAMLSRFVEAAALGNQP